MNLQYRFNRRVNKRDDGHWIWIGPLVDGHGQLRVNGKTQSAQRVSMHLYKGFDLNSTMNINHKPIECNIPACVHPDHLYEGTQADNNRDTVIAGNHRDANKTHCPQGHEYTNINTIYNKKGHRKCRKCQKISNDYYNNKRKELNYG